MKINELKELLKKFESNIFYNSDLKKLFQWFNLLAENNLLKPDEKEDKKDDDSPKKEIKAKKTVPKKPVTPKHTPKTAGVKGGGQTSMPSKKGG